LILCCGCAEEPAAVELGPCDSRVVEVPLETGNHVVPGTPIAFSTNPPATGTHYEIWARWDQSYADPPLERGYWVHNAEHGGVVFLYNCPDGCAGDVAALQALVDALPFDPHCEPPVRNRTIITADPLLPAGVRIAAVAWGWSYTASCVDAPSLRAFFDAHYGMSYENFCAQPPSR
jgi:hypothetical protein